MPEATPAVFRVLIRGTVEDVWNELTRTDEPIAAFFNSQMHVSELKPGARLAMRTANGKYTGVVGRILEVVPHKRFSHTFRFTNFDDPECIVINELEAVEGGVQFTLTIENLPAGTKTAKQMVQGGTLITNTMKNVIETGRPSFGIRMLYVLFKLMTPFSPSRSKSEHWPIDGQDAEGGAR